MHQAKHWTFKLAPAGGQNQGQNRDSKTIDAKWHIMAGGPWKWQEMPTFLMMIKNVISET
jgi:hypothetical protein